jgi:F-type H+-transporting ATPase subunit b
VRLEADLKEQLKGARLEAQKVIQEAEQDSDRLYREAMAVAQAEAMASRESARSKIDAQRADALSLLEADADRLADLIVDRLLPAS